MSGKTVVMELKTDPSVLAGVRVELEGKLFDGTVKDVCPDFPNEESTIQW